MAYDDSLLRIALYHYYRAHSNDILILQKLLCLDFYRIGNFFFVMYQYFLPNGLVYEKPLGFIRQLVFWIVRQVILATIRLYVQKLLLH